MMRLHQSFSSLLVAMKDMINFEYQPESNPTFDDNQLHALGNQAITMKLIVGHGYHQGQYEVLQAGKVLLLSPQTAFAYLHALTQPTAQLNG